MGHTTSGRVVLTDTTGSAFHPSIFNSGYNNNNNQQTFIGYVPTTPAYTPTPPPPPPEPTQPMLIHEQVNCDGCCQSPLQGIRYKCVSCPNFDLCTNCMKRVEKQKFSKNNRIHQNNDSNSDAARPFLHNPNHFFLRISECIPINVPHGIPAFLLNRSNMTYPSSVLPCHECKQQIVGFRYYCYQCKVSVCEACELNGK